MGSIGKRVRAGLAALTVAVLLGALLACSAEDDGPRQVAESFVSQWADQDFDAAAANTTDPTTATKALKSAWEGLAAKGFDGSIGRVRVDHDTATAEVEYTWTLGNGQRWTYPAVLTFGRSDSTWTLRWASTAIHPDLGAQQRLSLATQAPPRATVNESDGSQVLVNGSVTAISFDGKQAQQKGDVAGSVSSMISVLAPLIPGLSTQVIAEKATASSDPYPIGRISDADYDRLRDRLAIPGVVATSEAVLTPRNSGFASSLTGQIRSTVEHDLGGTSGWRVEILGENSLVATVLDDHPATPAPAVELTLSRTVQDAAQRAVNGIGGLQTMMVVLQASTGKILAVAQNPAADRGGLLATMGQYPPGSTFKMVTSAAAINSKLSEPNASVPCPGEIQIGPRLIPNYDSFSLGTVSLLTAFANSCNTTFADLASRMGAADLAHAAAAMGLVTQYTIPGIESKSGSVPLEPDLVRRSEDGFGQGTVLASPLGMALVAATIASGKTPTPSLINGRKTTMTGTRTTLPASVYDQIRPMMRAVVTEGTATGVAGSGEVFGKTGEAEVAGGSHAWFAGYRGDLAFATLIVRGGDSTNSVNVTRDFFNFLPVDYRP